MDVGAHAPTEAERLTRLEAEVASVDDRLWRQSEEVDARFRRLLVLAFAFAYGIATGVMIARARRDG